jgi:purine-nucleoside phosphorylase
MHPEEEPVALAAERLQAEFGDPPTTAIVLGSGLGVVVERMQVEAQAGYATLELPASGVTGHAGRAVVGRLGGQRVIAFSGRVHRYEGKPAQILVRYVRAIHRWGVQRLVLTCSAGGITEGMDPGHLIMLSDHINFMGDSPLMGPAYAERFPDMTFAHHPELRARFRAAAAERGWQLGEGIYAAMHGPSYETPAEIRMLRAVGADLVGMSTVPEILAAAEVKLPAIAIAMVSNRAAGLTDAPLAHSEVIEVANAAGARMADLLEAVLGTL